MNLYIKFLQHQHAEKKNVAKDLNPYMQHLLNHIAVYNHTEELPIRCAQLLTNKELGSPATIHKNCHFLIKKGYLKQSYSKSDGRLRYIELTDKSQQLFRRWEALLKKAVR